MSGRLAVNRGGILVLLAFTILFGGVGLVRCSIKQATCRMAPVFKVGGCDRAGYCAVEVEYGQLTQAHYPVVGHEVEVCMCDGKLQPPDLLHNIHECY